MTASSKTSPRRIELRNGGVVAIMEGPNGENPKPRTATFGECHDEIARLRAALKDLSDMYTHAWDRADGDLVMMGASVPRFEKVHSAARIALGEKDLFDGE